MAIGATSTSFGKYFRNVARITGYVLVHPTQGKVGIDIVIEFRFGTKGRPTRRGVAVLACERELPVRVRGGDLPDGRERYPQRYRTAD
jgi:hypothetical protein